MDEQIVQTVKEITETLLNKLDISAKTQVTADENQVIHIKLETEETGLLIGYHGETLYSLQLIIGLMTFRKVGTWTRIIFEVGDYRERREEQIVQMARDLVGRVRETNQPASMPPLTSNERRIIHLALQDEQDITSESEGEGENRRLVIKPVTNIIPPPEKKITS